MSDSNIGDGETAETDRIRNGRSVSRRRFVRAAGAGGVAVALANPSSAQDGGGEDTEITVTGVWTGGEEEDFLAVVEYTEEQTGFNVVYQPRTTEAILTGTLIDYEAEVAPADIVVIPSPARVQSDAEAGHLATLGDTWSPETFAPDPSQVTVEDEVYAAPFKMDLKPGFWYRQSFFDEHGLSEPEDYDQFLSLLEEINGIEGVEAPLASGNGVGWPLSDLTEAFILRQEDGAQLQQNLIAGEAAFTDDRVVTAFEEIQNLHQQGYFSELRDFGVQYEFFWNNETPLYFQGSFTPAFEAIQDPSDLGFFRLPGTEAMVASVNWFTVPTYSDNVEAARTVVETMVSAEGQRAWVERGGFVASNVEVPQEAYDLDVMVELTQMADEMTLVPDLDDAVGSPFQDEFWSQLTGLWSEPDQDVEGIVQRLDEVLQETVQEGGEG
jgi:multiple sugar transport system substrate-binding protein